MTRKRDCHRYNRYLLESLKAEMQYSKQRQESSDSRRDATFVLRLTPIQFRYLEQAIKSALLPQVGRARPDHFGVGRTSSREGLDYWTRRAIAAMVYELRGAGKTNEIAREEAAQKFGLTTGGGENGAVEKAFREFKDELDKQKELTKMWDNSSKKLQ